jgi:hypothetical protein
MAHAILVELKEIGDSFDSGDVPWADCWEKLQGWYNRWILRKKKRRQQGWWVNTQKRINLPTDVLREKMVEVAISATKHMDCDPVEIHDFYEDYYNQNHEPGFWRRLRLILREHPMVPLWSLDVRERDFIKVAQEDLINQILLFNHIFFYSAMAGKDPEVLELIQNIDEMEQNHMVRNRIYPLIPRSDSATVMRLAYLFKKIANEQMRKFNERLEIQQDRPDIVTLFDQLIESNEGK